MEFAPEIANYFRNIKSKKEQQLDILTGSSKSSYSLSSLISCLYV